MSLASELISRIQALNVCDRVQSIQIQDAINRMSFDHIKALSNCPDKILRDPKNIDRIISNSIENIENYRIMRMTANLETYLY